MSVDLAELEIVIFDVGDISFGTEVSQVISIVEHAGCSMAESSIQYVDLSMRLGTGGTSKQGDTGMGRHRDARKEDVFDPEPLVLLVDTATGIKGAYAESVRGVMKMSLNQIEPLPEFLKSRIQTDCIWGIGKLEQELVILLDLDRYLLDT